MTQLPKPDLIFTHESDLDGLVAGLLLQRLARRAFDADVPLLAYHTDAWKQRPMNERAAWVTDFAFDPRLDKPNWVVIDHHPADVRPRQATFIFDSAKSAGLLCYELLREQGGGTDRLDRLVHLNNVADLFLKDDPDFELASDYANLVKAYQFWNLHALIGGDLDRLLDHPLLEVVAVKRRVEDPLGYDWSLNHIQPLSPSVGYVETVVGNVNRIVHLLLERGATPYPVLLTLFRKANGVIIASLRSRNGEALAVAQRLQGGGHPNASGATLPRSVQYLPEAVAYLRRVLNPRPAAAPLVNSLETAFAALDARTGQP